MSDPRRETNSTIDDEIRVDTLPEDKPSMNAGSKVELSEEKITKDKNPEEEATLDWKELFKEEKFLKNDLWNAKHSEDKLSEKKKNELTKENMPKTETPKKPEVIQKKNELYERKMSQGEVFEESEDGQSGMVKSSMMAAEKTPKYELKEPPWRTPHLNFKKFNLKPSQLKFAKREVSKREGPKEMPPK